MMAYLLFLYASSRTTGSVKDVLCNCAAMRLTSTGGGGECAAVHAASWRWLQTRRAAALLARYDLSQLLWQLIHMHAAAPRCTCVAPPSLLHSLRLRAAWLTANSKAASTDLTFTRQHGRSGPPVMTVAAAAAPGRPSGPGRVATTQQSSRAVEAHQLLGFRALDLSSVPPKELGIVDDVRALASGRRCVLASCSTPPAPPETLPQVCIKLHLHSMSSAPHRC